MGLADTLEHRAATSTRQVDVEQDHFWSRAADALDRAVHVASLADDLELGSQLRTQAGEEELMVVHQEQPDRSAHGFISSPWAGTRRPPCRLLARW